VAAVVGSPVDVLKVRTMSTMPCGSRVYRGIADCIRRSIRSEGVSVFYKGFWANFARLGSWNVLMFVTYEQTKAFMGRQESDDDNVRS
jgi:solute carrier family 25 uncoupling protein 8/9